MVSMAETDGAHRYASIGVIPCYMMLDIYCIN